MSPRELEWIGTHAPAEAEMVRVTDEQLGRHKGWDSLHGFVLFSSDGRNLSPAMVAAIATNVHPTQYPAILYQTTVKYVTTRLRKDPAADPIVAALLHAESYGVESGPDGQLSPEDQAAFARREAHTLPHRFEELLVYTVDVSGRIWTASKRRASDGGPDIVHGAAVRQGYTGTFPAAIRTAIGQVPGLYTAAAAKFWTKSNEESR